jgi:uncharacterized protein (DUF1778 family)
MMLEGVSLDVRAVHRLASILDGPPRRKLEQALFFSAEVVALTFQERMAVLAALDGAPWASDEIRELLLAGRSWDMAREGIA